jgi:putative ABC transport system permease protein
MSEALPRLFARRQKGPGSLVSRWARRAADDLWLATSAMLGHKLRAALTLLGIVIGVFTVVSMMALVTGLQNSIDEGAGSLGANVFQLQKWPAVNFGPLSPEIWKRKNLTLPLVGRLREALPQAKLVGGETWAGGKEISTETASLQGNNVAGGTAEFFACNGLSLQSGRLLSEGEALSAARVAVIGAGVVDTLFEGRDPIGAHIRLGRLKLEVVGTLERQGGSPFGGNPDNLAVLPIGLFLELYGAQRSLTLSVMAEAGNMQKLQDQAVAALRLLRGLRNDQENDFEVFSNDSIRATFDELADKVKWVMGVVCALSLLVGGIGVMNIMLVAAAERTREIGLRKALGARRVRVLTQFVIEATLLATCGGVIGVLLGYAASFIARFGFKIPTAVPLWSVLLGLSVSSAIGLVFGIYPAVRASKLDPAVALRDE